MEIKPLYVSYYTAGNGYEQEAAKLIKTLNQFDLEHEVSSVQPFENWKVATHYKPVLIKEMMLKHPGRPLVWLDADARVRQYPALFDSLNCDVAAHYYRDVELLSSTIYFGSTKLALEILNLWISENTQFPNQRFGDQENLQSVIQESKHILFQRLPASYAQIFDLMKSNGKPVIEQMQASRRLKRNPAKR